MTPEERKRQKRKRNRERRKAENEKKVADAVARDGFLFSVGGEPYPGRYKFMPGVYRTHNEAMDKLFKGEPLTDFEIEEEKFISRTRPWEWDNRFKTPPEGFPPKEWEAEGWRPRIWRPKDGQ